MLDFGFAINSVLTACLHLTLALSCVSCAILCTQPTSTPSPPLCLEKQGTPPPPRVGSDSGCFFFAFSVPHSYLEFCPYRMSERFVYFSVSLSKTVNSLRSKIKSSSVSPKPSVVPGSVLNKLMDSKRVGFFFPTCDWMGLLFARFWK